MKPRDPLLRDTAEDGNESAPFSGDGLYRASNTTTGMVLGGIAGLFLAAIVVALIGEPPKGVVILVLVMLTIGVAAIGGFVSGFSRSDYYEEEPPPLPRSFAEREESRELELSGPARRDLRR